MLVVAYQTQSRQRFYGFGKTVGPSPRRFHSLHEEVERSQICLEAICVMFLYLHLLYRHLRNRRLLSSKMLESASLWLSSTKSEAGHVEDRRAADHADESFLRMWSTTYQSHAHDLNRLLPLTANSTSEFCNRQPRHPCERLQRCITRCNTSAQDWASPAHLLHLWRHDRRTRLVPTVISSWSRTDSLPRGVDAEFQFKNVGPLVGCPLILWIYFIGTVESQDIVQLASSCFQQICENMQSDTILSWSAGCLPGDGSTSQDIWPLTRNANQSSGVETELVFKHYDLIVALDDKTRELMISRDAVEVEAGTKVCAVTDFMDVCDTWPDALDTPPPEHVRLSEFHRCIDLNCNLDVAYRDLLGLALAGLERFLISHFPVHLKDRLHPHLIPRGI